MFAIPVIAGAAMIGYYLNDNGKAPRSKSIIRNKISKEDQPSEVNIYRSERYNEVDLQERRLADQYHRNAYELGPERTNIVPQFYNTIYNKVNNATTSRDLYPGSTGETLDSLRSQLKPQKVTDPRNTILPSSAPVPPGKLEYQKQSIYQGPMFESTFPSEQFSTSGSEEISLLTGLPLEKTHNRMVPWFGSKVTQNTDPEANSHLIEKFTGTGGSGINQINKAETDPFFELKKENIYGTPNLPDELINERYFQSNLNTNILPTPQIRVRSVKPEYIRPKFNSIDSLRVKTNPKISFEGRTHAPPGGMQQRGIQARVYKRKPPKFHFTGMDRVAPPTSSVIKHKINENFGNLKYQNRDNQIEEYFGTAYASERTGYRPRIKNVGMSEKQLRQKNVPALPLAPEGVPPLGDLDAGFEEPRRTNYDNDWKRNVGFGGHFVNDFSKSSYKLPTEERETTQFSTHDRNMAPVFNKAFSKRSLDKPKATHRQTKQSRRNGNLSEVGRQRGAYTSTNYHAKTTNKESTQLNNYHGVAENLVKNPTSRRSYINAYIRGNKENTITSFTPGPERSNITAGSESKNIQIKKQLSNEESRKPLRQHKLYSAVPEKNSHMFTKEINKLTVDNNNTNFGIIHSQLNNNPFAIKPLFGSNNIHGT